MANPKPKPEAAKPPVSGAAPDQATSETGTAINAATGPVVENTPAIDAAITGAVGEVTAINHADFDAVMKRFSSQGKTVVVKGPEKGRWRAGRHFTMEPTSIPLADLTDAELEKLCGDPLLTVAVIDAPY